MRWRRTARFAGGGEEEEEEEEAEEEAALREGSRLAMLAKRGRLNAGGAPQGIGRPSVYHAVVVIFLEFFAWGLLTTPMLTVLRETFSHHTFLMNGLVQGVKDVYKEQINEAMLMTFRWYFAMISVSGIFSVTFSVIFAYVADVTQEHERITAYGQVSATFAASLVTSPAIGAYLSARHGDNLVVLVATLVAVVDICFILIVVPESLPEKMRPASWGTSVSWEQADPFASLKKVRKDSTVLLICITVFLSYLPEAGQYSSFFLYLRQVIGFGSATIAAFIAVIGIFSIIAQIYCGSIEFTTSVVQGIITGIRGLCNGLGPALYGFIFFLFHVELNELSPDQTSEKKTMLDPADERAIVPGPPFVVGACIVLLAFLVALYIPKHNKASNTRNRSNSISSTLNNNLGRSSEEDIEPLLQDSSV
ncbi:hypothetical protein ASZ78_001324 [Callipepla squamata]|uniref:Major facilitator superfamily (MFS) profile domain-containing protein n=1 Tax=Callipepla squamata TaxID=9009 RepID=A0A226N6A6_CALSU|nr:hypothetical protein ASZ78_001324 [Callipepla squamata]